MKTNRLFTYPVLSEYNDDYLNSSFIVNILVNDLKDSLEFIIDYKLNCSSLEDLIKNKRADIVTLFTCKKTMLRMISKDKRVIISKDKLTDKLFVQTLIILKEDLIYYSNDLNTDYLGLSFNLKKGSILGLGSSYEINIPKENYNLTNISSIFSIINSQNMDIKISFDINDEKIRIILAKDIFENFIPMGRSKSNKSEILYSMLIIPSLVYALEEVFKDENSYISYENYLWYKVIKKKCLDKYKRFDKDLIDEKGVMTIAEELLDNPLSNAIKNLLEMRNDG